MGLITETNPKRSKHFESIVKTLCLANEGMRITVFCKNETTQLETRTFYAVIAEEVGLLGAMKHIEFKCLEKLTEPPTVVLYSNNTK